MKNNSVSFFASGMAFLLSVASHVQAAPGDEHEPVMLDIPAGSYLMGAPEQADSSDRKDAQPAHRVSIKPFRMGKYEITYVQYDRYADAVGKPRPRPVAQFDVGRGTHPVNNISWQDAADYAAWLSRTSGKKYRLPSEAEWQYAARAGTTTDYYWGDAPASDHANSGEAWGKAGTSGKDQWMSYAPVGQFPPNPFGLHDMHGNVWEWVQDCYNANYIGAPSDGSAWMTGDCGRHVQVGNSFHNVPTPVTERGAGATANPTVGFRMAEDY